VGLRRLSDNLQRLLDPAFLNCADAEIALAPAKGGAAVGVHRCILAARSAFFLDHFASFPAPGGGGERPRLELADLVPGGRHIGHDALVPVLGYLYTGRLRSPPQEATVCMDDACGHGTCRPAIDFVVESMYAASGFQISELISLFQVHSPLTKHIINDLAAKCVTRHSIDPLVLANCLSLHGVTKIAILTTGVTKIAILTTANSSAAAPSL
jgi:regulatory protein NPR1